MKDGKEDQKLMGLIEGGTVSLGKNLGIELLTFSAELPGLKKDQLKRDFYCNAKHLKHKEAGTRNA